MRKITKPKKTLRGNVCHNCGVRLRKHRDYSDGSKRGRVVWQCPTCRTVYK